MNVLTKDESMVLMSQPLMTAFSILDHQNNGLVGASWGKSPLMYPNLSFPEINISKT